MVYLIFYSLFIFYIYILKIYALSSELLPFSFLSFSSFPFITVSPRMLVDFSSSTNQVLTKLDSSVGSCLVPWCFCCCHGPHGHLAMCGLLEALGITVFQLRVGHPLRFPNPEPGLEMRKVLTFWHASLLA